LCHPVAGCPPFRGGFQAIRGYLRRSANSRFPFKSTTYVIELEMPDGYKIELIQRANESE